MKKVLFFLESLGGGGAEKVLTDLIQNLNKSIYDITVCTVIDGGIYQPVVEKHCRYYSFLKIADYNAGGIRKLRHWVYMKKVYSEEPSKTYQRYIHENYDVEVAFLEGFATRLIAASPNRNSKKICWVHIDMLNNDYADRFFPSIAFEKRVYESYDSVLAVSESVRESMVKKFGVENVKIQYNPLDSNQIIRKATEETDISKDNESTIHMITVGRLEPQKGYDRLLKVLKKLKDEGFHFELKIVGTGSMEGKLKKYIDSNHLGKMVTLMGFQKNPYPYIKNSDVFICSSLAEGFSTVATEALILGIPVFTTECSGMKELFGGVECGVIVPNTDISLYGLLKDLLSNKYDLEYFRYNAKKRSKDFDISIRIKEIESII